MKVYFLSLLLAFTTISLIQCKINYESAKYITQYEQKLEKCIKDIGYFSCSTLGKSQEVQQDCFNAIRTYDKCIMSTCFDDEYIEFKEGATFNYIKSYYQYAMDKSGQCERDPIVLKYANKSQSTKNYIEEKQDCFDKNAIIYNPNLPLTNIQESLDHCLNKHPKCDSGCQEKVTSFKSCIQSEEKKFTVQKSFWSISSTLQDFKKQIYSVCANSMKTQIDLSPQFKHYVKCIETELEKSYQGILQIGVITILLTIINLI